MGGFRGGGEFVVGVGRTSRSYFVGKFGRVLWVDGRACR